MVSVLEGQLSRTWYFLNQGRNHVINLYHDTITGVRSAMLDFQEIRGSTGNSSLLMDAKGHRIFFSVDSLPGYIEIKRAGWAGFSYSCVVNNQRIVEATEAVADDQSEVFKVKILGTTTTQDEMSEHLVTWYIVQTTRVNDGAVTTIHRRFRDFAEFNSQVKQNFKGHHLRELLPPLPEKPLKSLTDHKDPQFILDRQLKCETFLIAMLAVPHVSHMICTKAFVGLMDRVREYSVSFHVPQLGMSLIPFNKANTKSSSQHHQYDDYNTPVVVGSILKPEVCVGITPGDTISKINGLPVAGTNFQGIIARIKLLPRPLIIHFISVIGGVASGSGVATGADGSEEISDAPHQAQTISSQKSSQNNLEAYQREEDQGPLDNGSRGKKPDLFDAAYHNASSELDQPPTTYTNNQGAKKPAATPAETGPSQSELTAKKQAELSEASRKALEALKFLDEGDDDLLFGSGSSASGKKKDNSRSLFGSSGGNSAQRGALEEDLFAPIVPKKAAATSESPVKAAEVKKPVEPLAPTEPTVVTKTEESALPVPPPAPLSAPEVPPAPVVEPEKEEEIVAPPTEESAPAETTIQIDPFADDFVPAEGEAPAEIKTEEPVVEAAPAQPAPLGWDD